MRKKEVFLKTVIIVMVILSLVGCSEKRNTVLPEAETPNEPMQEVLEEQDVETDFSVPEELLEVSDREEIKIDFPFHDSEEYTLTLAKLPDSADEYELMLYGKDREVLQQISCGKLAMPLEFSYDGLRYGYYHDLEIFSSGSDTGLLFLWENERFSQEAIEIPKYDEVRNWFMLTGTEEGDKLKKQIYLLNEEKKWIEEVRSFYLERNTGWLEIQDHFENKSIFKGTVELDEKGNPVNSEYYEMLLWDDLNRPWNLEEQDRLPVWVGEKPEWEEETPEIDSFDKVQNYLFGNPGHTQDYNDKQELLEEFCFADKEPMYQYFDRYGNLQLELYMDEEAENICGIVHTYRFNSELEKMEFLYGFTQCMMPETEWEDQGKYLLKSVDGTYGAGRGSNYEEKIEYREDGRPDYFEATGRVTYEDGEELVPILKINFVYREDGTLYCRDYYHNQKIFGTTESTLDCFYDEQERIVYKTGYITHGYVEYYYIYEDESDKPAYCLYLDHNLGYAIPAMVKYH